MRNEERAKAGKSTTGRPLTGPWLIPHSSFLIPRKLSYRKVDQPVLVPAHEADPLAHGAAVDLLVDELVGFLQQVALAVEHHRQAVVDRHDTGRAEAGRAGGSPAVER